MGGDIRIRVSPSGRAAFHELEALATLGTGTAADADLSIQFAARFIRAVEKRERERVLAALRREDAGVRVTVPGG